uniref:Putative arrestin domain protein n=1 Tax=Panstrongylus lignarius TaxID=156445 RepID=A0A224XNV0_9HEMI
MGIPTFTIVLDSPTGSYYAGTNVTGRVLLTLDKQKKFRGLKIRFEGKAHVAWSERESVRKNDGDTTQETIDYSADEEYFSNKYYLAGSASNDIEIPAGEHVYPFTTTLPPQLPTSFEGEHGYVRYTIVATLDRPWKMDVEAKAIFQVVTPLDLNYHALAKEPVKKEETKTFCCFCCKSGPLTLVACVPHTGYVPGQEIPVTVEVDNASNTTVDSIELKIMKYFQWTVRTPKQNTKKDKVELSKMSLEGVEQNGSKSLTQNIGIPQMPFVNLDACSIINISFVLKVTACVSGMLNKNLVAEIPLLLGTVPIYNAQQTGTIVPPPTSTTPTPGDANVLPPGGMAGGYGQPGFAAQPPVVGFNPGGAIPMADGTLTGPSPQNGSGYIVPSPTQPGGFGGPAPQPMYPQPVYPDLSIEKLSAGGPGFNVVGGFSPTAPPQDSESAPLMTKPQ